MADPPQCLHFTVTRLARVTLRRALRLVFLNPRRQSDSVYSHISHSTAQTIHAAALKQNAPGLHLPTATIPMWE